MITCDHTAAECEEMESEMEALAAALAGVDFHCSCPYGYHGGWSVKEAASAEAIRASLPPLFGSHARVYQIETQPF
jgi:hypothetical protein